jgi:hypothetical protein
MGVHVNKIKYVVLFVAMFCNLLVYGYDEQTEYKLKVLKKHKPMKDTVLLEWDKSFSINNNSEESYFKMPSCFQIYDDKMFIVDNNLNKVNVYSRKGEFLKSIGRKGRGPGDFSSPIWMQFYNGEYYFLSNNGIDVYYSSLEFKNRIRTFHSFSRFLIHNDSIYCVIKNIYKGKRPFFVKMNMRGTVQQEIFEEDLEDPFYNRIKYRTRILNMGNRILAIPVNWNKIYIYGKELNHIKKKKLNYPLLDELEKWNNRDKNKKDYRVVWPARLYASMKSAGGKVYLLLQNPNLEILAIDSDGNITKHYYNENTFSVMRWHDFSVQKENNQLVFYIVGYSLDESTGKRIREYNVFRVITKTEN